jgi:hypothetical protein
LTTFPHPALGEANPGGGSVTLTSTRADLFFFLEKEAKKHWIFGEADHGKLDTAINNRKIFSSFF